MYHHHYKHLVKYLEKLSLLSFANFCETQRGQNDRTASGFLQMLIQLQYRYSSTALKYSYEVLLLNLAFPFYATFYFYSVTVQRKISYYIPPLHLSDRFSYFADSDFTNKTVKIKLYLYLNTLRVHKEFKMSSTSLKYSLHASMIKLYKPVLLLFTL